MADVTADMDGERAASLGRRYLLRFEEDTLRPQPLWIRLINPAVTFGFTARGVFPPKWVVPYWVVQFAGAICAALFLQLMFGDVAAGGNYPISTPSGEWKSLVMETVLTAILVSVILNTATGGGASALTPPSRSARRSRCWACSPARSAAPR
jgi:hypothetical protein